MQRCMLVCKSPLLIERIASVSSSPALDSQTQPHLCEAAPVLRCTYYTAGIQFEAAWCRTICCSDVVAQVATVILHGHAHLLGSVILLR
jgi:hypothetical protein